MGLRDHYRPKCSHHYEVHLRASSSTNLDSESTNDIISTSSSTVEYPPCPPPIPSFYMTLRSQVPSSTNDHVLDTDPQVLKLIRCLRALYRDLAGRDERSQLPSWTPVLPPGTLCPAHFQPALQLVTTHVKRDSHFKEIITLDQLLLPIKTKDGLYFDAPKRVLIESYPGCGKTTTLLHLLHSWATNWVGPKVTLAFFIPLRELRGSLMAHYLFKELLPRSPESNFEGSDKAFEQFLQLWKSLDALEDRLLFVLDGYDEAINMPTDETTSPKQLLADAFDLLEGRLFPECRIILTSSTTYSDELSHLVQRRIHLIGRDWQQTERLITVYFNTSTKAKILINIIETNQNVLESISRVPLGWLVMCILYEDIGMNFPKNDLLIYEILLKCLIRKSMQQNPQSPTQTPNGKHFSRESFNEQYKKLLALYGKLSLNCLKQGRYTYTELEIRNQCKGYFNDVIELGFLTRHLTFGRGLSKKRNDHVYTLLHYTFAEYLSAKYFCSIILTSSLFKMELEKLLDVKNKYLEDNIVLVLKFTMNILGRQGHYLFNCLSPLDVTTKILFFLLKSSGAYPPNVTSVCKLIGLTSNSWTKPVLQNTALASKTNFLQIRTTTLEMEGWSNILVSDLCTVKEIEIIFQYDRNDNNEYLFDIFFNSISNNSSLELIKISLVLGQDNDSKDDISSASSDEVIHLSKYLSTCLSLKKLRCFELIITCIDDKNYEKFYKSLLDELYFSLCHRLGPRFYKLVLDLSLNTSQIIGLCQIVEEIRKITVLHLPHLCCDRDSLHALSQMIKGSNLTALNLSGSYGIREDPPSSSGISMGSGSGSSGVTNSGNIFTYNFIKQNSLTNTSSPKSPTAYFSSLPRGPIGSYPNNTRSATLPRQPIEQFLDHYANIDSGVLVNGSGTSVGKRNSDSILWQRHYHPTPICDPATHSGVTFHKIFETLRSPSCKLKSINISKCLNSLEDAMCLGETIRKTTCLTSLKMEGSTKLSEVLPVLLGLADNSSLKMLDLASPRIILEDNQTQLVMHALNKNKTLSLLNLDGWTFRIEESGTLQLFLTFLKTTSLRDLILTNCRIHISIFNNNQRSPLNRIIEDANTITYDLLPNLSEKVVCSSIHFLRLGGAYVTINDRATLRGPTMLALVRDFKNLYYLDLSVTKNYNLSLNSTINSNSNILVIDDKMLIKFFSQLAVSLTQLKQLKIEYWFINLDEFNKTNKQIVKYLQALTNLSFLSLSGFHCKDAAKKTRLEHLFLENIINNLQGLKWLGLSDVKLSPYQCNSLSKFFKEKYMQSYLEIGLNGIPSESVKVLLNELEDNIGNIKTTYKNSFQEHVVIEKRAKVKKI